MKRIYQLLMLVFALSYSLLSVADNDIASNNKAEESQFSDAELAQILAPIALYPDSVLSHILIASTYPIEVVKADRWARENPDIKGADAVEAVDDEEWDPSVKALAAFPQILEKMSQDLDWTQKLGDAFLADEERLLASVQTLRQKAYASGNLQKMENYQVSRDDDDSIVIEPREKEIVYVPYYDTRVVYGPWGWYDYPPVYWAYPRVYHSYGYNPGHWVYWGPGIHLSYNFFFGAFHWHSHRLVVIDHYYYRNYNHRYYRARSIARDARVTHWRHNPVHRRGVSYRDVTVSRRYASNRTPRMEVRPSVRTPGANRVTNAPRANGSAVRRQGEQLRHGDRANTVRQQTTPSARIQQRLQQGRERVDSRERSNRQNTRSSGSSDNRAVPNQNSRVESRGSHDRQPHVQTPATEAREHGEHSAANTSPQNSVQTYRTPSRDSRPQRAEREQSSSPRRTESRSNRSGRSNNSSSERRQHSNRERR